MRHGVFQAAIHLYTPDNDYVVGAMVTHQMGSLGRAAVLHLLPETLVSNFLFIFFILLLFYNIGGIWLEKCKERRNKCGSSVYIFDLSRASVCSDAVIPAPPGGHTA